MTLLIFLLPAAVWGQARENGEVPRLEPAGAVVELASLEEPMSVDALIRIAFIASGTTDEDIETYIARMEGLIEAAPGRRGDAEGDAEVLLQWMHEGTLTRYVESQTRLDVLLDKGTYNCVSSAVLYMILVRSRGIPVRGVLTSDHAFCRIITGDDPSDPEDGIDVETTTSYGFDPGTRHEAVNSFSGRTGFTYVPPGNYRQRRDIGEKELISLIYQNRLAALQRSGRWVETVGLARDRWELAGSEASRNDFLTSIGNYAAEMNRQKRNIEALHFLDDAAAVLGENHGLADSASALLGNAVTYALRAGDTGKALAILSDEDAASLVPEAFLDERRSDVAVRILEERVKTVPFEAAVIAIDEALDTNLIDRRRWGEFALHLWSEEARRLSMGQKWLDGWMFLQEAPAEARALSRWAALENSYAHNSVVIFHNDFTNAMMKGRKDEARAILDEASTLFPGDSTLERDYAVLEQR